MKLTSLRKVLLFFSFLFLTLVFQSCRYETNTRFSLEETQEMERDTILSMLRRSKTLIAKEDLQGAISTLDSIIKKFGTYDEVEEAYRLRDSVQTRYVLKNILTTKSVADLFEFIDDYDIKEIKDQAKERISYVVNNTNDPQVLQDFLDSNRLPEFRNTAQNRQRELLAQQEKDLYAEAQQANDAETWKSYVKLYPDHPKKAQINDIIIKLEVDDIFAGKYEDMPSSNRIGEADYVNSDISIKNDTQYTLTVRYSGPENKRIIIPPHATENVKLKSGNYRITASVNSSRVTNYAGTESLNGDYDSSYYIAN